MLALLAGSPALLITLSGLLGLLVGSFLNVVVYRVPIMLERSWRAQYDDLTGAAVAANTDAAVTQPAVAAPAFSTAQADTGTAPPPFNLVTPRSACPACKAPITALQNIPVVSWLVLGGKCASCRNAISSRYPMVELLTGLLSAAVAWKFGYGLPLAGALCLTWFLIALTFIDVDTQLLPDALTLPLLWIGLFFSVIGGGVEARNAIIGALAGYLSLWSVYQAFRLATGKEGMGYGDFKLLAALGAWLGWTMLLPIVLLSAAVGALVGIFLILRFGRERNVPMAFGPYLAAAGWIALMWGPQIVTRYLGLFRAS